MPTLTQKMLRRFLVIFARRAKKNHLFEQPNERTKQPRLQLEKVEQENESVCFAKPEDIVNEIGSATGYMLVHHWATWCDGCMEELKEIQQFVLVVQQKDVAVCGVSWELFNGTPPQHAIPVVRHVHQSHGLTFRSSIIQGAPEEFFSQLQLKEEQIPQTALYRDGVCIYSHLGILEDDDREQMIRHVEEKI
jgi:hypothetical protein